MKRALQLSFLLLSAMVSFSQYGSSHSSSMALQQTLNDVNHVINRGVMSIEMWKGKVVVALNDGSNLVIKGVLRRDSSGYYIRYRDKELDKKDSGSIKKITPAETRYLKSKDPMFADSLFGKSNDSCWIFPIVKGTINLYTTIPTFQVHDDLVTHVQKDNGPIHVMSYAFLGELLRDNEEAYNLYMKKKITKAVKRYNKSNN